MLNIKFRSFHFLKIGCGANHGVPTKLSTRRRLLTYATIRATKSPRSAWRKELSVDLSSRKVGSNWMPKWMVTRKSILRQKQGHSNTLTASYLKNRYVPGSL
mmetsp:Transcript_27900/g.39408  ORF Transcript_27900/g.39408 Transcript_27900/m.39408 type:complete len:102 (+) Transcript_27900:1639-1944(+)